MTRNHAEILRTMIVKASVSLDDSDALEALELFPVWAIDTAYPVGIRVRYNDTLYRCEQTHTSQASWEPPTTPALWTEVAEPGEIPVWKQPTGAQDAYRFGTRVWYPAKDTTVYISKIDYNTYEPTVYGWEVVT